MRASTLAIPLLSLLSLQSLSPLPLHAQSDPTLWPEPQRAFFQDGPGLLLTPEQRQAMLALDEAGREEFIAEFLGRDPNLRTGIERRSRRVAAEFSSPRDPRAQLFFLRGEPVERLVVDCAVAFKPLEIWTYPGADGAPRELILYRPSAGEPFRLWLPIDSKRALYASEMEFWLSQWELLNMRGKRIDRFFCPDSARVDRASGVDGLGRGEPVSPKVSAAYASGDRQEEMERDFRWVRPENRISLLWGPADLASWARRAAATAPAPEPARLELGDLSLDFPRREGQRLTARALVSLPSSQGMEATEVNGKARVRMTVDGVLERDGQVFDELRMRYQISAPAPGTPAALLLERQLRPGQSFVLRLRVRDETSGAEARITRAFQVPGQPVSRFSSAAVSATLGDMMEAPRAVAGPDTLLLLPPPPDVMLGVWRAETVVSGLRIAKVVFLVDGQPQLTRTRPPYSAELRLATVPREQVVRVEGFDAHGERVAWDQVVLNQARGSLRVLITDPPRGSRSKGRVTARAEVTVPEERLIEAVEFRLNDGKAATLTQPPWQQEIEVPAEGDLAYLTVTARLDDGSEAEDVRFLRAPANLSEVQVDLVELMATALDGSGHPVKGLAAGDFEVLEAGKPQKIARFEAVDDLPLSLGIAIDTSFSMASSLVEAERAAAGFVKNLITSRDRCFTMGFAARPTILAPPMDDAEAVGYSLEGLQAYGRTALYDALLTALYTFRAQRGQRALVLLTDGDDTASNTTWEDALEYARRSGVAVYPIGLGLSELKRGARSKLTELAEATGGRAFFVDRADELQGAYGRIGEELRSRYLIAYSSDRPADATGYREVEVKAKRGLRVRVSRGSGP
ncbi:MAG: VWA domain-containing protein [Thermoanaerobaculia bacterium]